MFVGHLHQANSLLPSNINHVLQHLRETDYAQRAPGKYPIEGEAIFALVQDPMTQAWDTGLPEFHRRHIDVQLLLEGEEVIAYLPENPNLTPVIDHLAEKDIAFVPTQENETRIVLTPSMFAVFYPGELHRPCRALKAPMQIKKVVIKISII